MYIDEAQFDGMQFEQSPPERYLGYGVFWSTTNIDEHFINNALKLMKNYNKPYFHLRENGFLNYIPPGK